MEQSMTPSLSLPFEENNRHLVEGVQARLASFCAQSPLHSRFLNMLSLLEHIGSRKIMTSPAMRTAGIEELKHLAEESRHALFFKRAAERMSHRPLDYSAQHTMAGASARLYMGRLDVEISHELGPSAPMLPYLYMSLIVELRAVWLYKIYQSVLIEQKMGLSLKSILAEEELHRRAMFTQLHEIDQRCESRVAFFSQFEGARFRGLWAHIEEECAVHRLAAE
jgi:hypothetical protein